MLYLADQLENPTDPRLARVTFNMKDFSDGPRLPAEAIACGTAACIGGYACILFGTERISGHVAQDLLDLTCQQEKQLFYNKGLYVCKSGLGDATREEAVAAIRRMVQEHIDSTVAGMEPQVEAEVPDAVCN